MGIIFSLEEINQILKAMPENGGAGDWLRHDPVYSQINEARREEDDGMLRQAWEGNLKHADWQEVEKLCLEVLTTKSKDLQVFSWLIEARQHLYGLKGLLSSAKLFLDFVHIFWEILHPQKTEDPGQTFRTHIIEAMLRNIQSLVLIEPFSELSILFSQPPSLAKCYESDSLEQLSKRGGVNAEAFQKALTNGMITMDRVRNAFHEVYKEIGVAKAQELESCISYFEQTEKIISTSIGVEAPRFNEFTGHLKELKGLYNLCSRIPADTKATTTPAHLASGSESSAPSQIDDNHHKVTDRSGVYQAIRDIANFLFELDPHSPSPVLLKLIGSWENKNLAEILAELPNAGQEVRSILALLSSASQINIVQSGNT